MTRISTMRGIKAPGDMSSIPANLYFDYSKYTEGELQLLFLREKAQLLTTMYPDSNLMPQWSKSINRINDVVYKGLSNFNFTGLWSTDETTVAKAISFLKSKTNPSNGAFLSERKNPSVGTDPLIPLEDTYESCKIFLNNSYGTTYDSCVKAVEDVNYYKTLLNNTDKGLEKSSLQFLYNWTTSADLNNETIPFENRFKMQTHKNHIFELERITGLSSMNLSGWVSLGILRQTALKLATVMTPEDAIAFLKANPDTPIFEVGDPRADAVGFPLLILVAILVLASFIGISGLIQTCQGREPTAFKYISNLATIINSPGGKDFIPSVNTGGGTGTDVPCKAGYTKNAAGLCVPMGTTTTTSTGLNLSDPLVIGGGAAVLAAGIFLASK